MDGIQWRCTGSDQFKSSESMTIYGDQLKGKKVQSWDTGEERGQTPHKNSGKWRQSRRMSLGLTVSQSCIQQVEIRTNIRIKIHVALGRKMNYGPAALPGESRLYVEQFCMQYMLDRTAVICIRVASCLVDGFNSANLPLRRDFAARNRH